MTHYYDLQDTLVHINYNTNNIYTAILDAITKYTPTGPFQILTAQRNNPGIHKAITQMVKQKYPQATNIHFVSGSEQDIIKAKAKQLTRSDSYTDSNLALLKQLAPLTQATLYHLTNGKRIELV
jgi:hypothetical protein